MMKRFAVVMFICGIFCSASNLWGEDDSSEATQMVTSRQLSQTEEMENFQKNTTILMLWINKTKQEQAIPTPINRTYKAGPLSYTQKIDPFIRLEKWHKKTQCPVIFYYDGEVTSEEGVKDLEIKIHNYEKNGQNIKVKDIREIDLVKENPDCFEPKVPIYFRSDLLKIVCSLDHLKNRPKNSVVVYTDFSVKPIQSFPYFNLLGKKFLFDKKTIHDLKTIGFIAGKMAFCNAYENGFHMMSNCQDKMIEALKIALVKPGISAILNPFFTRELLSEYIYVCMKNLMDVFLHLEEETIKKSDKTLNAPADESAIDNFLYKTEKLFLLPKKDVGLPPTTGAYKKS